MSDIKPWLHGLFELLKHAEGHVRAGGDFDKCMALISFDNTIEVAIATFLQLRPDQRGGSLPSADREIAKGRYHPKLELLYRHAQSRGTAVPYPIEEVKWRHEHRNELYHEGKGFVPEERALTIARDMAFWTVSSLYRCDAHSVVASELAVRDVKRIIATSRTPADLQFMQACVDFEKTLIACLVALGVVGRNDEPLQDGYTAWKLFVAESGTGLVHTTFVDWIYPIWSQMRLGQRPNKVDREFLEMAGHMWKIGNWIAGYCFSRDILPELTSRFPNKISPDIRMVRVIQKHRTVFLEITRKDPGNEDETAIRCDLSMFNKQGYTSWPVEMWAHSEPDEDPLEWQLLEFPPTNSADESAAHFLEYCSLSVLMGFEDLVTKETREQYEKTLPPFDPRAAAQIIDQRIGTTMSWLGERENERENRLQRDSTGEGGWEE